MSHFHAIPDVVAVTADRLVVIVRVGVDGSVVVRDLAYGALSTTSAAELSVPPALRDPTVAPVQSIVQATDAQWARARRRGDGSRSSESESFSGVPEQRAKGHPI